MQYLALSNPQIVNPIRNFTAVQYINRIIPILILLAFVLCAVVFVIILIYGGIQYITSGGDRAKLEDARGRIINAITGLIILLILWLVLQLINMIFGINIGGLGVVNNPPIPTSAPSYRPALCDFSTISRSNLPPGEFLNLTLRANTWVSGFQISFYNLDNMDNGSPRPIIFEGENGTHRQVYYDSAVEHTFTITHDEVNRPDTNWSGQIPVHIQVNGYFFDDEGNFSAADTNCVENFLLASEGQCIGGIYTCNCICGAGEVPIQVCDQSQFPTCGGTCSCRPYSEVYPPGLILHYALDEGTGTNIHDSSGYDLNGTLDTYSTWTTDASCGGSINLPEGSLNPRGISGPSGVYEDVFMSPSFTYAAWVKVPDLPYTGTIMDTNRRTNFYIDGFENRLVADIYWDDVPGFNCGGNTGGRELLYGPPVPADGSWHHTALTYDDATNTAQLYLDGSVVASSTGVESADFWCTERRLAFTVGHNIFETSGGNYFGEQLSGNIDEVRVYNYALSAAEMSNIYHESCTPAFCLYLNIASGQSCNDVCEARGSICLDVGMGGQGSDRTRADRNLDGVCRYPNTTTCNTEMDPKTGDPPACSGHPPMWTNCRCSGNCPVVPTPIPTATPIPATCQDPYIVSGSICYSEADPPYVQIDYSWSSVSGANSYYVEVDDNSSFSSPDNTTLPGWNTEWSYGNIPGTYYGRVRVETSNGSCVAPGEWSNVVDTTPCIRHSMCALCACYLFEGPGVDQCTINDDCGTCCPTAIANRATGLSCSQVCANHGCSGCAFIYLGGSGEYETACSGGGGVGGGCGTVMINTGITCPDGGTPWYTMCQCSP